MTKYKNPTWWTAENDSAWDRTKAAFKRDWDQTKHDLGGKQPDTEQHVTDTVKQAAGKEIIPPRGVAAYDKAEPAYRFGHGARSHYGKKYPQWDDQLETELKRDWQTTNPDRNWNDDRGYIQDAWTHKE
ncbi:MAG TPA: hypothetical protein VFY06_01560 [Verrucomicrobiae bacterium]|nr:hypothetical protein [Verrucomicrobiae bacterium]